jgi:hypothetical protein
MCSIITIRLLAGYGESMFINSIALARAAGDGVYAIIFSP